MAIVRGPVASLVLASSPRRVAVDADRASAVASLVLAILASTSRCFDSTNSRTRTTHKGLGAADTPAGPAAAAGGSAAWRRLTSSLSAARMARRSLLNERPRKAGSDAEWTRVGGTELARTIGLRLGTGAVAPDGTCWRGGCGGGGGVPLAFG